MVMVARCQAYLSASFSVFISASLTVKTMKSQNLRDVEDDFPALGATAAAAV